MLSGSVPWEETTPPGRFCLGGEVLLEQVGADPEAGGTWNSAAGRRLLWPLTRVSAPVL
jgi:hypothetical protein